MSFLPLATPSHPLNTMNHPVLFLVLIAVSMATEARALCSQGKYLTSYARSLGNEMRSPNKDGTIRLPSRFLAGVQLANGKMNGFNRLFLMEEPVNLFCQNETLGALQTKFQVKRVTSSYDWTFNTDPEVKGIISLVPQDFYLDVDVERDAYERHPSLLGIYWSQPNDTFDITVTKGADNPQIVKVVSHVQMITRTVFGADAKASMDYELEPRIENFLLRKDFSLE